MSSVLSFLPLPRHFCRFCFFFFNDTATTEIYTLSLHDALPIYARPREGDYPGSDPEQADHDQPPGWNRSEEHTSELQSQSNLVCRLLLEKKKRKQTDEQVSGSKTITLTHR